MLEKLKGKFKVTRFQGVSHEGDPYRGVIIEGNGHKIQATEDRYGYHTWHDNELAPEHHKDQDGFLEWLGRLLG